MECDGKLPFGEVPKRKTMILSLSYFKASQLSVKLLPIIELSRDRYSVRSRNMRSCQSKFSKALNFMCFESLILTISH